MKDVEIIAKTYAVDLGKDNKVELKNLMNIADKYSEAYKAHGGKFSKEGFKSKLLEALIDCYIKGKPQKFDFENPENFANSMTKREIELEAEQANEETLVENSQEESVDNESKEDEKEKEDTEINADEFDEKDEAE